MPFLVKPGSWFQHQAQPEPPRLDTHCSKGPRPRCLGKAWRPLPPGTDRHGQALPSPTVGAWRSFPRGNQLCLPLPEAHLHPSCLPACLHLPPILSPIGGRDRPSTASLAPALTWEGKSCRRERAAELNGKNNPRKTK